MTELVIIILLTTVFMIGFAYIMFGITNKINTLENELNAVRDVMLRSFTSIENEIEKIRRKIDGLNVIVNTYNGEIND